MSTSFGTHDTAGGGYPLGQLTPEEDVTIRLLRQQLKRGNKRALPVFISQAKARAAGEGADQKMAAHLRYEAAVALRALGRLDDAEELLHRATVALPPGSLDLLNALRRLQVSILLDRGRVDEARKASEVIDGLEFERVRGADPLVDRTNNAITAETWALLCEIALVEDRMEDARHALDEAAGRLSRDAAERNRRLSGEEAALAAFDPVLRREEQAGQELKDYLRLLEALWACHAGDARGREMFSLWAERLDGDESADARLVSLVSAAVGLWQESVDGEPRGINLFEARRWMELANSVALSGEAPAAPAEARPAVLTLDLAELEREAEAPPHQTNREPQAVVAVAGEQAAAVRPSAGAAAASEAGWVFGGKFTHIDLLSLVHTAEKNRFTGYMHATWDGRAVAPMIESGNINRAAGLGEGWIFFRDGLICDATLGSKEPEEDGVAANEALMVLGQVGLGVGLQNGPLGEGYAYADETVGARRARLEIVNNEMGIIGLITEEESEAEESRRAEDGGPEQAASAAAEIAAPAPPPPSPTPAPALVEEPAVAAPAGGVEVGRYLALVTAPSLDFLAESLCASLQLHGGGVAVVKIVAGDRVLSEAHTNPWGRDERRAASGNAKSLQLGSGLRIETGTAAELGAELVQFLLEAAALRLKAMPRTAEPSRCYRSCAGPGVVVESLKMRAVYDLVSEFAAEDHPVLIAGETGTGKDVIARRIHELSNRSEKPFVPENFAGLPDDLFRSTLFGHVRGAFSGAESNRDGMFTLAAGGTAFIDEYGELDMVRQGVILRVLQDKTFTPVGSDRSVTLTARLLMATNRPIDDESIFRQDIKYRCKVIRVPPLREHPEDIRPLALHFLKEGGRGVEIGEAALAACEGHHWPGNVRELREVLDSAARAAARKEGEIKVEDITTAVGVYEAEQGQVSYSEGGGVLLGGESRAAALGRIEKEFVREALRLAGAGRGRLKRAAEIFGETRQNFSNLMKKHGITGDE